MPSGRKTKIMVRKVRKVPSKLLDPSSASDSLSAPQSRCSSIVLGSNTISQNHGGTFDGEAGRVQHAGITPLKRDTS
jgi:hypothetical protein